MTVWLPSIKLGHANLISCSTDLTDPIFADTIRSKCNHNIDGHVISFLELYI